MKFCHPCWGVAAFLVDFLGKSLKGFHNPRELESPQLGAFILLALQTKPQVIIAVQPISTARKVPSPQPPKLLSPQLLWPPVPVLLGLGALGRSNPMTWCWPTLMSSQTLSFRCLDWNLCSTTHPLWDHVSPAALHSYQMPTPMSSQGGCTQSVPCHPLPVSDITSIVYTCDSHLTMILHWHFSLIGLMTWNLPSYYLNQFNYH